MTETDSKPKGGLSRRSLLTAAAAVPLVAIRTRPARAAEFTYKLATGQSLTQPINARLDQATQRIREASGGRLELKFFPASQLGSDTDLITQVRSGGIEFLNIAGSVISTVAAGAAITNVGFAFADYDQAWRGADGPIGQYVRTQIEKAGLLVAAKAADNSFRQITSASKPIRTPDDLKGYRIRVPVSPIFTSLFSALGASPTSINFNELYTALQTRLVDGQENGLVAIDAGKLYEVQKYVSETNHIWDPFWIVANRRAFGRLPEPLQEIVRRELDRAAQEQREDVARLNGTLKTQLVAKGLVFEAADKDAFRRSLTQAGFYRDWKEKFGPEAWKALESVTGALA
ncbi:TRAP dicarboxylate transporter, DctP subunit [Methylobacterium sp. 4-46]|uniref:TRAP transporter substrate-binding protein n=1 Tax=unclassified Methylobacterium TaxID=2615210 RepID=UPI000152D8C4|nr:MULTISPECIES: TRAP transporter substrate-binding protein [Methylobacterium]ACA15123.1 TRAP dicarboxylate transporter, DctP subunit [Methylobacterium sp. 4-46]WFT80856.1 TRAP transporter substrate-binding protein [Methylobacterium nodulans]